MPSKDDSATKGLLRVPNGLSAAEALRFTLLFMAVTPSLEVKQFSRVRKSNGGLSRRNKRSENMSVPSDEAGKGMFDQYSLSRLASLMQAPPELNRSTNFNWARRGQQAFAHLPSNS